MPATGGGRPFADCNGTLSPPPAKLAYQAFEVITASTEVDAGSDAKCDLALSDGFSYGAPYYYVAVDCLVTPQAPNNIPVAGDVGCFTIDYSLTPPHLKLAGASCRAVQQPGLHHVDIAAGCQTI